MKFVSRFIGSLFSSFRQLSLWKKLLVVLGLFILSVIFCIGAYNRFKKPGYTTDKVKKENITERVTESGSITLNGRVDVYSPTTGVVEAVYVANGDPVKENQDLFRVKSSASQQEKQAALSDYMAAKSLLETAKANMYSLQSGMFSAWDTYKTLAESDGYENDDHSPKEDKRTLPEFMTVQEDWLAAENLYKNQQNVVSQYQAKVNSAWLTYQATQNAVVKSPVAGSAANLSVVAGSSVTVNTPLAPAGAVLSIMTGNITEAVINLGEDDVVKVKEGQEATVSVDAIDGKEFKGTISRIDALGTEISGVMRFRVYIEIENPDKNIRPGMSVDADITTRKEKDVLVVPNSAVKPYKGGKAVRVPGAKNGDVEYVPVKTGIRGEEKTQIIKGLSEGQIFIISLSGENGKKPGPLGF